jgi:hypothetical protein
VEQAPAVSSEAKQDDRGSRALKRLTSEAQEALLSLYSLLQHRFTAFWHPQASLVKLGKLALAQCLSNSNERQRWAIPGELHDPIGSKRGETNGLGKYCRRKADGRYVSIWPYCFFSIKCMGSTGRIKCSKHVSDQVHGCVCFYGYWTVLYNVAKVREHDASHCGDRLRRAGRGESPHGGNKPWLGS